MAETKEISLAVDLPVERMPTITATTGHIQVILRNLLTNAIKYTPERGAVTAKVGLVGLVNQKIEIQVCDNGQGIAAEDLPRITERFYRADKARSRETEGVGLGLTLVNSIVALYHGEFLVQSEGLGKGTTASVLLPILASHPQQVAHGASVVEVTATPPENWLGA